MARGARDSEALFRIFKTIPTEYAVFRITRVAQERIGFLLNSIGCCFCVLVEFETHQSLVGLNMSAEPLSHWFQYVVEPLSY